MAAGAGGKIELAGAGEFNAAMRLAASQARALKSEMAAVAAQFSKTDKSQDALTAQNKVLAASLDHAKDRSSLLSGEIDKQRSKLDGLGEEVSRTTREYGENSKEAANARVEYDKQAKVVADLEKQYNDVQTDINTFTRELDENEQALSEAAREAEKNEQALNDMGRGYDDAEKKVDEYGDSVDDATEQTKRFGRDGGSAIGDIVSALGLMKIASAVFGEIKQAASSAFDRIDTTEQFKRTLTVMTGSAEDADRALQSVSETVKGTAYGLDVAAKGVQNFVTSGMGLNQATNQVKVWADAVSFFGDGTNSSLETVTDALGKMTAAGKVSGQELNRLTDVGIPVVQLFADATGRSFDDVRSSLSDGSISAQEFQNVLAKAMTEGTDKFEAISGAAQSAGASWKGTFDNFKAYLGRGMTEVINSIDTALQEADLPSMREMIASVGKEIEGSFKKAAEAIGPVVKFVAELWKKLEPLHPAIKAFAVGLGIAAVALLAVAAAQKAVNLAMSLFQNPIGIIIAVIAALVGALIYLWNTNEGFRDTVIAIWEGIKNVISTVVNALVTFFTETLPNAIKAAIQWFRDLPANILEFLNTLPEKIGKLLGQVMAFFANLGIDLLNWVRTEVPKVIDNIITFFRELPGKIWSWLVQTVTNVARWGLDMQQKAKDAALGLVTKVVDTIRSLPGKMLDLGKDIVRGIWNGITSMVGWIKDKVMGFAGNVLGSFKKGFKTNSPSRLLADGIGRWLPPGIVVGFESALPKAIRDFKSMSGKIAESLAVVVPEAQNAVLDSYNSLPSAAPPNNTTTTVSPTIQITINADGASPSDTVAWKGISQEMVEHISEKLDTLIRQKLRAQGAEA